MKTIKTKQLTLTAIFLALILLFTFTPIGFINFGIIRATLVHIPVIIASILLGPRIGAFLGTVFGAMSLLINTISPTLLSFVFSPFIPVIGTNQGSWMALIICFLPRILIGILPYYLWKALKERPWNQSINNQRISLFAVGMITSFIHTILVMNLIFFLFNHAYAQTQGTNIQSSLYHIVLSVIVVNGLPEAILAGIATSFVTPVLFKFIK